MRLEKPRLVNLNLLITFAAIAEEKSVTAAASRLLLSQPAVSRALQRARALFQDDLLVRSPSGFELTLRGRRILDELEGLVPTQEGVKRFGHNGADEGFQALGACPSIPQLGGYK